MKKSVFLFLIFLSIVLLCRASILEVHATNETVFFEDDFEKYDVGTFPYDGGWELWFAGRGSEYQVIVDSVSNSPTRSLQLLGHHDYSAAYAAKPFATEAPRIGFEVNVRVEEIGVGIGEIDVARAGFSELAPRGRVHVWAGVLFLSNGSICIGGARNWPVLQSYVADRWYKVKLIMDRPSETYSVWIDDVSKGENLDVTTSAGDIKANPSFEIKVFSLSQNYNSVRVYYDDVKVFQVFELNPRLELIPTTGLAATTVVGSGFAPNSRITITWNGTTMPTVPSPLLTNVYGNFTAIISVLDQATAGAYILKAVDGIGTEATATFTVIPEFPIWIILPSFIIATFSLIVLKKRQRTGRQSGRIGYDATSSDFFQCMLARALDPPHRKPCLM